MYFLNLQWPYNLEFLSSSVSASQKMTQKCACVIFGWVETEGVTNPGNLSS